jgi:hypothetical protein
MKQNLKSAAICGSILAAASMSAQAGVALSVDSTTTLTSTSWSGSPAGTPSLAMFNPNSGNSVDGNVSDGIFFKPSSSFTLGAFEFYASSAGSIGTYNLSLYDLGSSFTLPATSPLYTFTGSEADLFSGGLNFTTTAANQFEILTFSGADQTSINAGDSYLMLFTVASGSNLIMERGPITANQALGVNTVVVGANGTVLNNVPAGANRTPVAAFFPVASAPEPTTLALAGLGGLASLVAFRRRNK